MPRSGRCPGEGNGTPLQYSCLENSMDGGAWWAAVHGIAESQTRLSDFTFTSTFMHWRRKWQPTPVFLPGESQGRGSLVGCHLWGRIESDMTEVTQQQYYSSKASVLWCLFSKFQFRGHYLWEGIWTYPPFTLGLPKQCSLLSFPIHDSLVCAHSVLSKSLGPLVDVAYLIVLEHLFTCCNQAVDSLGRHRI